MAEPDLLGDPLLQQIYDQPWLIRRTGQALELQRRHHLSDPAEFRQLYMRFYEQKTGEKAEQLALAPPPDPAQVTPCMPGVAVAFPGFECLTDEAPSAHARRASRNLRSPPVDRICITSEVLISLNHDIPTVAIASQGDIAVVQELSTPHHNVLHLRGGARIFRQNQIAIGPVYYFNDHFGANNFAHWLLDWVPRLKFLVEDAALRNSTLLFGMPINRVQRDTLGLLGIDESRIIQLRKETLNQPICFAATQLAGPSICGAHLRRPAQGCAPWALEFVRSTFLSTETSTRSKRLLINRRGTRRLLLSPKIRGLAEQMKFEEVFLEGMPIQDQASLFNQAEIIISAHGAALSNLAFCQPKTKVLEIFPQNYSTSNFFALSSALNLEYFCAVGISRESKLGRHLRDYNVEVPDHIIERFLA